MSLFSVLTLIVSALSLYLKLLLPSLLCSSKRRNLQFLMVVPATPKAWWSSEVASAVAARRNAFAKAHRSEAHRQAYLSASRFASATIAKAKTEARQQTCFSLSPRTRPRAVFSLLRYISGTPKSSTSDPSFPGTLLLSNLTSLVLRPRSAAAGAAVSVMSCVPPAAILHFILRSALPFLCQSFLMISPTSLPPPPGVPTAFPIPSSPIPPPALSFLLHIFNLSWSTHSFPSAWKFSSILPVHKSDKPTDAPSSFRPISLTSCISKLFARLTFLIESQNLLTPLQAGYRPGRSTLDQVLLLAQSISDGFHRSKPAHRTVLATVDFSRSFDSVWHPGLFHKFLASGLPPCFVRWTQSFLAGRRAHLSFRGAASRSFRVRRGVP